MLKMSRSCTGDMVLERIEICAVSGRVAYTIFIR